MDYSSFYRESQPRKVGLDPSWSSSDLEMGPPCGKCGIPVYKPTSKAVMAAGYIECLCVIHRGSPFLVEAA